MMVIFTNCENGRYNVVGALMLHRFYVPMKRLQKTKVTGLWNRRSHLWVHINLETGLPAVVMAIVPTLMTTFMSALMSALMATLFTIPIAVPAGVH